MELHSEYIKIVHRLYSSCISSIQEIHEDSIEFSLLSADKGAVGFILAQELAILTVIVKLSSKLSPLYILPG